MWYQVELNHHNTLKKRQKKHYVFYEPTTLPLSYIATSFKTISDGKFRSYDLWVFQITFCLFLLYMQDYIFDKPSHPSFSPFLKKKLSFIFLPPNQNQMKMGIFTIEIIQTHPLHLPHELG